ncbi:hypothetical protein BU26DRAFT_531075 [Trematosphaeria pertusa]|uniref:Sin3 binding protein-domain-containing protein n=1 Tax=Trematosphaeria pertusa TaxID=390896 RepID=A0A6A6IEU8_9PLEO|nr:uncharacterized protein BU26DRAFT_531075 [Trematosphaeria pertusa]KAF2249104.1 hypothetical protein BU26DRAFT_531075 [Trematosphaeria pertusa]
MAAVAHIKPSASSNIPISHHGGPASAPAHAGPLITPPNSISPTLSAHKRRPGMPATGRARSPSSADMDIDLQDAVEHAAAQDQPTASLSKEALAGLDASRQITALMLAKHHLPTIILGHGAMPIREMMAHLNQTVPGFSRLPPAKARRLIVAALEHRAGGGLHGEVKFEKVGWGRWSVAGQSSQTSRGVPIGAHGASRNGPTPPASVDSSGGLQVPKHMRAEHDAYSGSWAAGSPDSRDEEMADQMSLDGSGDSDSDTSDMDLENDLNDETDEEDWSAIGPEALRQRPRPRRPVYRDYNYLSRMSGARYRSTSAQSVPPSHAGRTTTPAFNSSSYTASRGNTGTLPASNGVMGPGGQNAEREAIEALIAMGSM